jgi:hypothetical protein
MIATLAGSGLPFSKIQFPFLSCDRSTMYPPVGPAAFINRSNSSDVTTFGYLP